MYAATVMHTKPAQLATKTVANTIPVPGDSQDDQMIDQGFMR